MSEAKSLPRSISVLLYAGTDDEKVVTVEKLPLGRAAALGLAFRGIPAKLEQLRQHEGIRKLIDSGQLDNMPLAEVAMKILEFLPELLEVAADAIIDILAVGTGLSREELREKVGLDEATELLAAVIEVNNLGAIQKHLKAAISRLGRSQTVTTTPAAG
ncbi:MAG: hypothetical protein BAA04_04850 [Firmicutes bacterium ZCTH02-B6]|nr:MAG: hypothetical protein BAA04_04850 [Firmicutes bacterium ZCTH02-B6]